MDDLASTLSQILGNPEAMNQLKSAAAALGLGDMAGGQVNSQPQMNQPSAIGQTSVNSGMNQGGSPQMNNGAGFSQGQMPPVNQGGNPPGSGGQSPLGNLDLSALGSVLGSLGLGQSAQPQQQSTQPPIDMGTLMKIQNAFSRLSRSDKNVDLLMALKPHLSEERGKKVDDAVKIMQLIKLLPLIKESGLFGGGTT